MTQATRKLQRSAPEGGYDFPEKEAYRSHVWGRLAQNCPVPRGLAQVLLMPSAEGLEIDVAIRRGFREENIHAVDRNPAIVATLKRKYPKLNTYGVEMERACARIAAKGLEIHVANFDFTACMGFRFGDTLSAIARSKAMHPKATWATTLLRGRETLKPGSVVDGSVTLASAFRDRLSDGKNVYTELQAFLQRRSIGRFSIQRTDALRVGFMLSAARSDQATSVDLVGIYPSGNQTMLWAVFRPMESRSRISRRAFSNKIQADQSMSINLILAFLDVGIWRKLLAQEDG